MPIRDDRFLSALHELDLIILHEVQKGLREYASQFCGKECVDVLISISDGALFFHFEFANKVFIVQGVALSKVKRLENNLLVVDQVLEHVKEQHAKLERRQAEGDEVQKRF